MLIEIVFPYRTIRVDEQHVDATATVERPNRETKKNFINKETSAG